MKCLNELCTGTLVEDRDGSLCCDECGGICDEKSVPPEKEVLEQRFVTAGGEE